MEQGLSPTQLLERHFNLKRNADSLTKQLARCEVDMKAIEELLTAQQIENGAVQRLLQKQAEDKKAADEKAKKEAEVDEKKEG